MSFVRDFYYYNTELVSFLLVNLWFFTYFIYCVTYPIELDLQLQSNKQILLHALAGGDPATDERISAAISDAQADALFQELVPDAPLDSKQLLQVLSADNEVAELAAAYTAWRNQSFTIYFLAIAIIIVMYLGLLAQVWYYSYITHSTLKLFVIMTANILYLMTIRDPFTENNMRLLPVLEALKKDNPHVLYLSVEGQVLVDHRSSNNIGRNSSQIIEDISAVLNDSELINAAKENRILGMLSRGTSRVSSPVTRAEAINTTISRIQSTSYYDWLWAAMVFNYMWRVYNLINGLSPHITFDTKLQI